MLTPTCVWHCLFAVCITIDPVAPETLTDGLRSFCAEFSAEMVNTCAACGCRDMVNTHPCTIEEGGVLSCLRLTDEAAAAHLRRTPEVQSYYNIHRCATTGTLYHLMPDFVRDNEDGVRNVVNICEHCIVHLRKGLLPKFSLAHGYDFGRTTSLPELSLLEKVIIAPFRSFATILKLRPARGRSSLAAQTCLEGHAVMFRHDAVRATLNALPGYRFEDVSAVFAITFLGSRTAWRERRNELLRADGPHSSLLACSARNIMRWLRMMRDTGHSAYQHLPADAFDFDVAAVDAIDNLPSALVDHAHCEEQLVVLQMDDCAGDDTSRIRPHGAMDDVDPQQDSGAPPATDGIQSVFLGEGAPSQEATATSALLTGLEEAVNEFSGTTDNVDDSDPGARATISRPTCEGQRRTSDRDGQERVLQVPVRTETDQMVNEFTENSFLLGFPYLFPLGIGEANLTKTSISKRLLLWHDSRFASDDRFLFYLYDTMRRWSAALGVSVRVKANPQSVSRFNDLLQTPGFRDRVSAAAANPSTAGAHALLRTVKPLLVASGKGVPFGPAEKSDSISKMAALVHYAGLPLWFWTISPSDIDSVPALRIAGIDGATPLPSLQDRARLIAKHPAAAARAFQLLINAVVRGLFGHAAAGTGKTTVLPQMQAGSCTLCGGVCLGYFGVLEAQGRGSLHIHGCLVCGLGPLLLQRCQADALLSHRIAELVDSVIVAALPEDVHADAARRREAGEGAERVSLRSGQEIPMPDAENIGPFRDFVNSVMSATNMHVHTHTCRKGPVGSIKCRVSFARGTKVDGTGPVHLEKHLAGDGTYTVDRVDAPIPGIPRAVDFDMAPTRPFISDGLHFVMWELGRLEKDKYVVETATSLCAAVCGNTNVQLLGSTAQAKAAIFYLFKYMEKDAHALTSCLSLLKAALLVPRASVADDTDTNPLRRAQLVLTRCLNKASGAIEVSSQQAAAAVLGQCSYTTSAEFAYCFVRVAACDVQRRWNEVNNPADDVSEAGATEQFDAAAHDAVDAVIEPFEGDERREPHDEADVTSHEFAGSSNATEPFYAAAHDAVDAVIEPFEGDERREPHDEADVTSHEFAGSSNATEPFYAAAHDAVDAVIEPFEGEERREPRNEADVTSHEFAGSSDDRGPDGDADVQYAVADSGVSRGNDAPVDHDGNNLEVLVPHDIHEPDTGAGSATLYRTGGTRVAVPQHVHYKYRGPTLGALNLYEYTALVKVVQKPGADNTRSAPTDGAGAGRRANATYDFDNVHPLSNSHHQQLRSKVLVPILAGRPPPRFMTQRIENEQWQKKADQFGLYYTSLLVPWSTEAPFLPPVTPDWAGICEWARGSSSASSTGLTWVDRCRYDVLAHVSSWLHVAKSDKDMMASYRGRAADHWSAHPDFDRGHEHFPDRESGDHNLRPHLDDNVVARIEMLRDQLGSTAFAANQVANHMEGTMARLHASAAAPDHLPGFAEHRDATPHEGVSPESCRETMAAIHDYEQDAVDRADRGEDRQGRIDPSIVDTTCTAAVIVNPPADLNPEQRAAFARIATWAAADQRSRAGGVAAMPQNSLLLLVHGGPGTGKSHFARTVARCLQPGLVTFAATTGVAAAALPCGRTIHSLLNISTMGRAGTALRQSARAAVEQRLGLGSNTGVSTRILFIDEMSMMGAALLNRIDVRLREIYNTHVPFGGIALVLMGDFYQLPPVGSKPLFKLVLAQRDLRDGEIVACQLFKQFQLVEFRQQMRAAECSVQSSLVLNFRTRDVPLAEADLQNLRQLSEADVRDDPSWLRALIVTPGNLLRHAINLDSATRLARTLNVPVLRWKLHLEISGRRAVTGDMQDAIHGHCKETWGYFVRTAPAFLDNNINPTLGMANGTPCCQHSIVLSATTDNVDFALRWAEAAPGDFLDIEEPTAINVSLANRDAGSWPRSAPCAPQLGPPIVPVSGRGKTAVPVAANLGRDVRDLRATTSNHELGFAITFHKVQGQTLDKVILCLEKPLQGQGQLSTASLYVGLTRVRRNADMRIFPLRAGASLDHLLQLKKDRALTAWRQRYDALGKWHDVAVPATPPSAPVDVGQTQVATQLASSQLVEQRTCAMNAVLLTQNEACHLVSVSSRNSSEQTVDSTPLLPTTAAAQRDSVIRSTHPTTARAWPWGRPTPGSDHYSWLFVPLIHAALGTDDWERCEVVRHVANDEQWTRLVLAYRDDFAARGITAATVPFAPNGYIEADVQERLLYTDCPMYELRGESRVTYQTHHSLLQFAVAQRTRFL